MKETAAAPAAAELRMIPIGQLRVMAGNPRKEFGNGDLEDLAASIRVDGILEPLLVREYFDPENPNADGFEIVAGERRYRAGKLAKLTEVPCIIRAMDDTQAREIRLIENLQRRDLSELEEAAAFQDCLNGGTYGDKVPLREDEFGPIDPAKRVKVKGAVEAFAKKVGKSAKFVYDRLKLLELAAPAAKALESGQITAGHAIEIARRPVEQQKLLVDETLDANLTVRQLRDQIRDDEQREEEEAKRKEEKPKKHRGAKGESAAAKAKAAKERERWDKQQKAAQIARERKHAISEIMDELLIAAVWKHGEKLLRQGSSQVAALIFNQIWSAANDGLEHVLYTAITGKESARHTKDGFWRKCEGFKACIHKLRGQKLALAAVALAITDERNGAASLVLKEMGTSPAKVKAEAEKILKAQDAAKVKGAAEKGSASEAEQIQEVPVKSAKSGSKSKGKAKPKKRVKK